jgi:hypothetical protein
MLKRAKQSTSMSSDRIVQEQSAAAFVRHVGLHSQRLMQQKTHTLKDLTFAIPRGRELINVLSCPQG